MIKLENCEVVGWEHAIRGMRNPKNSWKRSDSEHCYTRTDCGDCSMNKHDGHCYLRNSEDIIIGPNDHKLMMQLASGGPVHAKYRRMITVYVDITAPLYFWKEFDTYKVGTVANSCSTMHKIHERDLTRDDFSFDWDNDIETEMDRCTLNECGIVDDLLFALNRARLEFVKTKDKRYWDYLIKLLPESYNQKRTIMMNYEVLVGIYKWRKDHKLQEWREFCKWIESLPYSEIITGAEVEAE